MDKDKQAEEVLKKRREEEKKKQDMISKEQKLAEKSPPLKDSKSTTASAATTEIDPNAFKDSGVVTEYGGRRINMVTDKRPTVKDADLERI